MVKWTKLPNTSVKQPDMQLIIFVEEAVKIYMLFYLWKLQWILNLTGSFFAHVLQCSGWSEYRLRSKQKGAYNKQDNKSAINAFD